jgi:hypothetical protein
VVNSEREEDNILVDKVLKYLLPRRGVLWARPMIFGGKEKAEISGRAGYNSHVIIYEYMY